MTGLECLRQEMARRGANKAMIESKTAVMVLDILTEANGAYQKMDDLEGSLAALRSKILTTTLQLEKLREKYRRLEEDCSNLEKVKQEAVNKGREQARKELGESLDYIAKFNEALKECETAEGRDVMKTAQIYVNSVNIDTKYDNTAYIVGLAAILSNSKINALSELRKINTKLPTININGEEVIIGEER